MKDSSPWLLVRPDKGEGFALIQRRSEKSIRDADPEGTAPERCMSRKHSTQGKTPPGYFDG